MTPEEISGDLLRRFSGKRLLLLAPKVLGRKGFHREVLRQAAAVAAYHSKARSGGVVAVNYTLGKHVSKPRGAKPGTVSRLLPRSRARQMSTEVVLENRTVC